MEQDGNLSGPHYSCGIALPNVLKVLPVVVMFLGISALVSGPKRLLTHLQREGDISGDLLAGGARVLEALDVQHQHFGQAVDPEVLCGCRPLIAVLTLECLVTLSLSQRISAGGTIYPSAEIQHVNLHVISNNGQEQGIQDGIRTTVNTVGRALGARLHDLVCCERLKAVLNGGR